MTAPNEARAPSVVSEQPARFLLLAAWFGLLTGLVEVSILAIEKLFFHKPIHNSPHVIWMAPMAELFLLAIPGLILFLMAWQWPRLASLRVGAFIFAFFSLLSLLFRVPHLHKWAALLLSAGVAFQIARLIAAYPNQFYALVRRTLGWSVIFTGYWRQKGQREREHGDAISAPRPVSRRQFLLSTGTSFAGLALGVHGWKVVVERNALAQLATVSPDSPNVLLIVLDTVRAQSLSLYGYSRPTTPQLERLAKTGVCFERAISTAPWTLPSHASMFTGRLPHELSTNWWTPLDSAYPTLAEVLSAHGYLTAAFIANIYPWCTYEYGLNRGFVHYEDYPVSPGQIFVSSSLGKTLANIHTLRRFVGYHQLLPRKSAAEINGDFLRWLARKDQRPFFAFLNYFDAHDPYLPPPPFDVKFGPNRQRLYPQVFFRGVSPQETQAWNDAYDGTIAYLDHHLGLLYDEIERRGLIENTLIIVTSDHGEEFGEHGVFGHGNSLYLQGLHVPLLISFPSRVPAGKRVFEPVSLRDLPATVADLLKLADRAHFPGYSLARYWQGTNGTRKMEAGTLLSEVSRGSWATTLFPHGYPIVKGDMRSLVAGRYHYIKDGSGQEELYDFETDPLETRDLVRSEEGRRLLEQFRTSLASIGESNRKRE